MDITGLVIAYLVLCLVAGVAGRNRRIGFWGFLFCSMVVTPILSLLFLYFAAPRKV
jgi:Na+/melibiose symporter-like transporter